MTPERSQEYHSLLETSNHAHACECETSISLANHPELVKMNAVPPEPAEPLNRLQGLRSTYTAIWWYGDYPEHYAGDARCASREKGLRLRQIQIDDLAEYIAAVKADCAVADLQKDFFDRTKNLGK
jgi:creatinine amidohydrolase